MRVALGLEYRGSAYCGWQTQRSGCAIQDSLERALEKFIGLPCAAVCAGRTDTGVHAMAQVVHLDSPVVRDDAAWVRGTNSHLPADIRVRWARQVDDDFHARYAARTRTYRYFLLNDAVDTAAFVGLLGWFHIPLDVAKMQQAATMLLGEHDFSAFRAAACQAKSPVRIMASATVEISASPLAQRLLVFSFCANAFLHHMVRNIVGELVYVGAGRRTLDEFVTVLNGRDRRCAAPTFAPDGLYLTDIDYDQRFALPSTPNLSPFGL
jgi:tRNA pseudouridine38-40 synthase